MAHFIALQATYNSYQIGIYTLDSLTRVDYIERDKRFASRDLIPEIDALLKKNNIRLQDLCCISVNQGPGPFTSQRVIITTVNGIAFGYPILLAGIDNLKALLQEFRDHAWPTTIALLNAYNKDLYYCIEYEGIIQEEGCKNIDELMSYINERVPGPKRFIGNGAALYAALIKDKVSSAFLPDPMPEEPSLDQIARMGKEHFNNNMLHAELEPIYLKKLSYKPAL